MASTADQLSALGRDGHFQSRVMALAVQQAGVVYAEDPATPNHATRVAFAKTVLSGGGATIPITIAQQANLVAGNTTYDFPTGAIKTDVTDAAITSQLSTSWNMLSGV